MFQNGCALGSWVACDMLGLMLVDDSETVGQGVEKLEHTCEQAHGLACANLGLALTTRVETPTAQEVQRGLTLMHDACLGKYPSFCPLLVKVVARGRHEEWFARSRNAAGQACNCGNLESCNELAMAVEDGTLGMKDFTVAGNLGSFACERGYMPACNTVGYMLVLGHGFAQDPGLGTALFYHACANGYGPACDSMGEAMEKGWGFQPDMEKAEEFYRHACSLGSEHACKRLSGGSPEPAVSGQ